MTSPVQDALARIDALDAQVQAWVYVDRQGALAAAQSPPPGPFTGLPIGVKDIIDVAGQPTTLGAGPFAHYVPDKDADCVARLRAAGAIPLGKTHTTEFAYLDPAPTRNPWDLARTPGGSSSGSAAAVAAGMVPLALGSQTVGSVLRPAAYCGIVGLKASYGLVSYAGVAPLAPSFDHVGVLCRDVATAARALAVLAEPAEDYAAAVQAPRPPCLGLVRRYHEAVCGEEVQRHLQAVAQALAAAGAAVRDVELPAAAEDFRQAGDAVLRFEAAAAHRQRFAQHGDRYRPAIRALVEAGLKTSEAEYEGALQAVRRLREETIARLADIDAFLLPVAPSVAPLGLESTGQGIFCAPASFTGLPAISLPSGLSEERLPLAVQLVAGHRREAALLAAAAWVEGVLAFTARPPLP